MSGFSAELIDYLDGSITFEEFDRRREEREEREEREATVSNDAIGDRRASITVITVVPKQSVYK